MQRVLGIKHLFQFIVGGSGFSWGFGYLFLSFMGTREPQSTSGVGRPAIPSVWANFQGNSQGILCRLCKGKRGSSRLFLFTPASRLFLFTQGGVRYSHQHSGWVGRFLGRYRAEERFRGHLFGWRLADLDPRLRGDSERRADSSRSDSGMSKTASGRSARLTAAASGGAASISRRTSRQAARGWDCTGPGLGPPAILASRKGSVKSTTFFVGPKGDPEKESR